MEKTAMEIVLAKIAFHLENSDPHYAAGLELINGEIYANDLKAKEREQIIGARIDGALNDMSLNPRANSEDYFTQKYGNR